MYKASFTRSSCLLSRSSIDVQWCVSLVVLAINIGAVHTFFTSTLMTVFSQNIGKKFPISSSQLLSLYVLVQFYTNLRRWVYVLSSSGIQSTKWTELLSSSTNTVHTMQKFTKCSLHTKDCLHFFSASWISRNSHYFFLNDLIISMREH